MPRHKAKHEKPPPPNRALAIVRLILGWDQETAARAIGIPASTFSDYERGRTPLSREHLGDLFRGLRVAPGLTKDALALIDAVERSHQMGGAAEEEEQLDLLAEAGAQELKLYYGNVVRGARWLVDRERAAARWPELRACKTFEHRFLLVEKSTEYRGFALVARVCAESIEAAADSAEKAVNWARLALRMSEVTPGDPVTKSRAEGFAGFHLANAWRVHGELPEAGEALGRAQEKWKAGAGAGPELFSEPMVLQIEASLRREQLEFDQALALLERALALKPPAKLAADLVINRANVFEMTGKYQAAVNILREIEPFVGSHGTPRQLWLQRFGLLINLCHLGLLEEAQTLLPEAQALAARTGNELDLLRVDWACGRVAAGLGLCREATTTLERVHRALENLAISFDTALVALELAAVYMEEGRTAETKALAQRLVPLFEAQEVHKEARRVLELFCEAVRQEVATADWTRRVVAFLYRAQGDPRLKFEAAA